MKIEAAKFEASKTESSGCDIRIPYRNWVTPTFGIARVLCPAFYLFGAFAVLAAICNFPLMQFFKLPYLVQLAGLPNNTQSVQAIVQIASYILIFPAAIGMNLALLGRKQEIIISPERVFFPLSFTLSLLNRRQRSWNDVSAISVLSGCDVLDSRLAIFFKSGGRACIRLSCIPKEQIEQLGLALELRATTAKSPELAAFLDAVHDTKLEGGELSFTRLWEEEMNSKFSSVAFLPLAPGQTLKTDDYKIERQLSFGGLCAVYLAQTPGSERVVLKEVALPQNIDDRISSKAQELLTREAALLLKLAHPQIVPIRAVFTENNRTYLVLDYVAGENLRQIVRQTGPVSEDVAKDWATQLLEILSYLHERQPPVLHRDISPDNIMIGNDGKLMLIDFGVANEFLSSITGTMVGKQSYVAPEQFRGHATPQSDIYSLGATLFFLLTGKDPEPLSESSPKEHSPSLSSEIDALVKSCTQLDTTNRIQNAADALQRLSSTLSTSAKVKLEKRVHHE